MSEVKRKEIRGLLDRECFKVILKEKVPPDSNIIPGRLVLALKSSVDDKIKYKTRHIIGEHVDCLKNLMVYSSTKI